MSLPDLRTISEADVLAVLDARGGGAYIGSVETGLSNRLPFAQAHERRRAIERALASGAVVRTQMGLLRRRPVDEAQGAMLACALGRLNGATHTAPFAGPPKAPALRAWRGVVR